MTLSAVHRFLPVLALALAASTAAAQGVDFRQSVELALKQNPQLAVTRSRIEQAQAALREAEAGRLPRLNLSLTATHTNDPLAAFGLKLAQKRITAADFNPVRLNDPKSINNLNTRVELLWPLYTGGQVDSALAQARALIEAAQAGDAAARQQLIEQVLAAYQGVHAARAQVRVAEQSVAAAEEHVRVAQRLHQQGMALKSDVLSARVQLEEARLRLAEANNGVAAALDRLKLVTGRSLDEPLEVGPPVMPTLLAGSEQELRRQALTTHAEIAALRRQIEAAAAAAAAARAARRPQVSLMLRQDWNDKGIGLDASSQTAAAVLNWTAFDGEATRARVDRAEAARLELTARLRQAEDAIGAQVAEARRRALEAEARVSARELAVELAEESLRLVRKRYENAMGTMLELVSAQAQLDRARSELVVARYELVLQRAALMRAVGVLEADRI
ncbi:MAG: TolC family protein [Thiobacillaceae bacterium]|nr:TolC family protein [Thiobacillaceae bacterium]